MATTEKRATVEDLYRAEGKAELVNGQLKIMDASGLRPSLAAGAIGHSLMAHVRTIGKGVVLGDGAGFLVDLPNRQSFSPYCSYYTGPLPEGLKFAEEAPVFAVEVRSENDYKAAAEREMRDKRADYFAAGTLVVWDVDLLADDPIRVYRGGNADAPAATFRRGALANAEPAVPGWRFPVDELFV